MFDKKQIGEIQQALRDYSAGKYSVDNKASENQEWWRLRHWANTESSNKDKKITEVGSAWAVNSILNKHADIMDSFPKPNILAREADDEEEAKVLSKVIPSLLEQNNYEDTYYQMGYDLVIDGTAVTGVFWDNSLHDGLGDVSIRNIDIHNVFYEPGVEDIQDSKYFFNVSLEPVENVKQRYPDIADKVGPQDTGVIKKYLHDDNVDTSQCVEVIDVYYKNLVMRPVEIAGITVEMPKEVVHMATIIGDQCVFCSEDVPTMAEKGFYWHGKYPFVFRALFPIKDCPCGFGYLDIMKNPQRDIDRLDQAIIRNVIINTKTRYFVKANSNIDKDQFADINNEIIETGAGELDSSVKKIEPGAIPTNAINHLANKIDELKETSGNRDFSQGSTQGGVTAGSAIAALQEAGSKLSRDVNKVCYRGFREECYLVVELIRQFYTESRTFRIEGEQGGYEYAIFDNTRMLEGDYEMPDGTVRHRRPIYDIEITSEKASPFSRAAQNETAKELYQLGLFNPDQAIPAMVCLNMMDFEGKDKIVQQIQQNATMLQQFQMMAQFIAMNAPDVAVQMGLLEPQQIQQPQQISNSGMSAEERAAKKQKEGATAGTTKARTRAAESATV